jgi:hypothetical protein
MRSRSNPGRTPTACQGRWYVLDVMRQSSRRRAWVAILIDTDPESWTRGQMPINTNSSWLFLGKHQTRRRAWNCAERLLDLQDAAPLVLPCAATRR